MRRIADPLREMGARIDLSGAGVAPMRVHGSQALHGIDYELPLPSAQLKSALLLAGLGAQGTTRLSGELASRDHTERMLPAFGGSIVAHDGTIEIAGGQRLRGTAVHVPGDASSAAYWIAAGALLPDSRIEVQDVGLNPSRIGFLDVMRRMGAKIEIQIVHTEPEPIGNIIVESSALRATEVLPHEVPALIDELPLLAVVASFAEGTSHVAGAAELRVKESDRIDAVVRNGTAMGMRIEGYPDGFAVRGPVRVHGAAIDAVGDHRIAMAFAIAALAATSGTTTIEGAGSAAVSYPSFFSTLESLRNG
jgi:3-phosphoshikimate 1-carboxyvinyltransferase